MRVSLPFGFRRKRSLKALQWAVPMVWAPERMTRSSADSPFDEKRFIIWSTEKLVSTMFGRTFDAADIFPSLRPVGTSTEGPPVCAKDEKKESILI